MQQIKERIALTSIAASGGLTLAKGFVGVMSGSLAILSEAAHSLSDLLATVITYFAVRVSGKPADEEHHYGHGKIESIAALAATALLFLISGIVLWEAAWRLFGMSHAPVETGLLAFGVIVVSIVVDFFRARALHRVADETSSEALEADALHFGSDMWSSIAVLVGLWGVWLGYPWADAAAASVVATYIFIAGWRLARRTVSSLADQAPPGVAERVERIVGGVSGVIDIERLRVRRSGAVVFVDLSLAVSRTLPLDRVADLKAAVARAIEVEMPAAEVSVVTSPRALDDESVLERVLVIARNRALAVHHLIVHAVDERLAVSLDLEVDGKLSLAQAHAIADELEQAIGNELGSGVEVETHIEPLQIGDQSGQDAHPARIAEVEAALSDIAARQGPLRNIHDVRVRETADGEIVNFHCDVDAGLTVDAVHDYVDTAERALRQRWPTIKRVTGHAEPTRTQNTIASG
jgi:cation diffusion facilitator family transporter